MNDAATVRRLENDRILLHVRHGGVFTAIEITDDEAADLAARLLQARSDSGTRWYSGSDKELYATKVLLDIAHQRIKYINDAGAERFEERCKESELKEQISKLKTENDDLSTVLNRVIKSVEAATIVLRQNAFDVKGVSIAVRLLNHEMKTAMKAFKLLNKKLNRKFTDGIDLPPE